MFGMVNVCPVCGYLLPWPASDFHICASCGTEFGYDDAGRTHAELRAIWLRSGARWWNPTTAPPVNWDPYLQLDNLLSVGSVWTKALGLEAFNQEQPSSQFAALIAGHNGQENPSKTLYGEPSRQRAAA
jgi:hypothetical protein